MRNANVWTSGGRFDTRRDAEAYRKTIAHGFQTKIVEKDGKHIVIFRDRAR